MLNKPTNQQRLDYMVSDPRPTILGVTNNFAKLASLFTECFERLYPDKVQKSPGAKKNQRDLREFALEHELLDAATTLQQQAAILNDFANTIFLDACAYRTLQQAAGRSNWIPPQYTANDWIADCVHFLHHGHPKPAKELEGRPIDMVLHCPVCHTQHVDRPMTDHEYTAVLHESSWWELGGEKPERWMNPPHRSHLCHSCGHIWRPADVFTNGVLFVQTRGSKDSPLPQQVRAKP